MSLRWIFMTLLFAYAVDAFSAIDNFDQLIRENNCSQLKLASKLHTKLELKKQKTLDILSESDSVSLEGFNLKVY